MPSPLSNKDKTAFIEKLKNHSNSDQLKTALSKAVCDGLIFPSPIEDAIWSLRQAYQDNKNTSAEIYLKKAIDSLIDENIFPAFSNFLQGNAHECPAELVHFLAKELNILLDAPRLVQVAIEEGKIYWRVKEGDIVIYDRQIAKGKPAFVFTEKNSVDMTWEQFREYKDTGKRYGTVKITRELFTNYFKKEIQNQANAVWNELKDKQILDEKNHFSSAWKMTSAETISLSSLTDAKWVITKDALKNILKGLKGAGKKSRGFTYLDFIQAFKNTFTSINEEQFISIFNALYAKGALTYDPANGICTVKSLVFKEAEILLAFQLNYTDVVNALYEIANNAALAEIIEEINVSIYRPERSIKSWAKEGGVSNAQPKSQENCAKLWDVSLNKDLTAHRNTAEEKKQYEEKLNYDHVPSADRLRNFSTEEISALANEIKELERQQRNFKKQIEEGTYRTREELSWLEQSYANNATSLSEKRRLYKEEDQRYGNEGNWYSVAIPEKLHRQGDSYMKSSAEQLHHIKKPFFQEFESYIAMLTKRSSDFGFDSQKCVFLLIAAFRHLYRSQVKELPQTLHVGQAPYRFFQKELNKTELDQMILSETKKAISAIS